MYTTLIFWIVIKEGIKVYKELLYSMSSYKGSPEDKTRFIQAIGRLEFDEDIFDEVACQKPEHLMQATLRMARYIQKEVTAADISLPTAITGYRALRAYFKKRVEKMEKKV